MGKAVKAVASVAVGVAVGFATGNPYLGVLAGGAMFASSSLTPEANIGASTQTELKQVIRSSKEPAHYQFGRCAVGGLLAWAQEEEGDQSKREWLHLVYVLSEGDIESLDELYLNQELAADADDLVQYALIRSPSTANQYLLDNSSDWRDSQIGKGLSFVRLSLKYDRDYWASGIPTPLFVMRGNREIYDPRTETTGYSDNWALVILWYLRTRLGVPDDEIIWDMFISAANVSDEPVTTPDGGTERRYTIGGGFKADTRKDRVLADMEAAGGGQVVRIGGKFGLMAGAYYGPYELTIDEDMVIGAVSGQTEVAQADAVNTMTGKFIDPDQRWSETDYPAVSVAEWIEADGGPIEDSLDLQYVFSPYQAQRLANIALRKKRAGGSLSLTLNFRGYACRPGRVVRVYLPSINIDGEFRITDWDFHGDSGCKVALSAEDPEIYDDAVGEPYDPLGFISLPTGGIAAPAGLTYILESIGETVQGRLDWSAVTGAQSYSVVLRSNGQAVQAIEVPPSATTCTVGGLPAGQYVAEVRTRGSFGQSGAATVTFSVNAPPMPDSVIVQVTNNEVTLIPQLAWNGTPVSFRFYYSPTLLDANQVRGSAQLLSTGASLVHTGRAFGTTYYYWIESVNAYGHSDLFFQEVATTDDFAEEEARINEIIYREGGLADQFQNDIDGLSETIDGITESVTEAQQSATSALEKAQQAIDNGDFLAIEEDIRHAVLQAQTALGNAVLDVEHVVRVGEEQALAQQITTLSTSFGSSIASLTQQLSTLSTTTQATADLLTQLRSEYDDSSADFEQRITTLTTSTQALTQSVSNLQSSLNGVNASISTLEQTIALDELAQAIQQATLQTQNALGNAVVDVENLVRVDAETALAQQITTVSVEKDQQVAQVRQELAAVYDPSTGAVAQAVTTVEVNGVKGVVGIQVAGGTAQIVGIADQFAILNPISGELVTAFVVTDGRVVIPDALIRDASITAAKIANAAISSAKIADGAITRAKIGNAAIGSAQIENASITSAKIGALQVDTAKIANQAVTINSSSFSGATVNLNNNWNTVVQLDMDPQGQPLDILLSFSYDVNATLGQGETYGRRSILGRIVAGSFTYDFEASYGYLVDERQYTDGLFRRRSLVTIPRRVSGWSGSRTVSLQLKGDANSASVSIAPGELTTWQHYIKLSVSKK